jgi:hypothetical protein
VVSYLFGTALDAILVGHVSSVGPLPSHGAGTLVTETADEFRSHLLLLLLGGLICTFNNTVFLKDVLKSLTSMPMYITNG